MTDNKQYPELPIPDAIDLSGYPAYSPGLVRKILADRAMRAAQPKCLTCNGHGMVGGLLPGDGGYDGQDCPDCNPAQPDSAAVAGPSNKWRERWYGSGGISGLEGWSIVDDRTNALIAYLGREVSSEAVSEIVMAHNAAPTTQAPQPMEPAVSQGEAELPDSIRVPLDSLHADAEYLVYRADQGHLTKARIVGTIRERVDAAKAGIRTALATRPQEAAPSDNEKKLRRMLCVAYAGSLAYMDDGEMQDSAQHPFIDFLRDSADEIQARFQQRGAKKLAAPFQDAEDAEDAARFRSFAAAALTQEDSYLDAIESGDFDEPKTLDDIRALFDRAARTQEKNNG